MIGPLKILHLEDNERDAALVKANLGTAGLACDIERVVSGSEYKKALQGSAFDLILSDFSIPSYSGLRALECARELAPRTPFIFVSGTIGEDRAVQSMLDGATDYVLKDNLKRLVPAIKRALDEKFLREERSRVMDALRQSEENRRLAMEAAQIGMWFWDVVSGKIVATPIAKQVLGLPPEAEIDSATFANALHPDDRAQVEEQVRRAIADRGPYKIEARTLWPDGSVHWLAASGRAFYNVDGKPKRMVGVAFDITERRRLEEDRARTADALKRAQAELLQAQKLEAVGRLAGGVAHDFNNLLTAISGYSTFLLKNLAADDPNRADVEEIQKAGERAAALTHQLLAFSRRQVLQPKILELNSVATGMEKMLRRLIGEHIDLRSRLAPDAGRVKADAGQLEQVLMNLVLNARDAMPEGGVLTVETSNVELDGDVLSPHPDAPPGPYVQLSVTDTGQGMAPEIIARIFEPFFTTKEQGKGTGLGLATVYGIVKQTGGCIFVESAPGRGTTFKVCLPRIQDAATAEGAPAPVNTLKGSETILLVEDDELVRRFAVRALTENGYRVLQASSPGAALRLAGEHKGPLHLVLSDVVMPGMPGFHLVKLLKTGRPDTKVIFMSGYTDEAVARHELLGSGSEFIQKPLELDVLLKTVRRVLDESK